jgi:hypothetical protein
MRPVRAEPEDVPEHASDVMPGLSMLVEMSLEPSSAPNAAYSVLLSTSRELAAAVDGLVEDPQEGSVTPAVGRKRFAKPRQEERFAKVQLSWWYTASPLRTLGGASELLRLVATHVPEAVPHRYGFFAPLPHHTAESGHDALAGFLHENLDRFARYDCKRPAVHFHVSDCDFKADDRLGFRTNLFSIGMEHQALREPSREHAVRRLW